MLNRSAILVTALLYENVPKEDVTRLCENEMGITIAHSVMCKLIMEENEENLISRFRRCDGNG